MNYEKPVALDDIIEVTRRNKDKHREKLFKIRTKLLEAGCRARERKSEFFLQETIWLGYEITEHGIKMDKDMIKATLELKSPKSCKELKSFLGPIQYVAKFIPTFSEKKPTE